VKENINTKVYSNKKEERNIGLDTRKENREVGAYVRNFELYMYLLSRKRVVFINK